jgi:hypothetical protein
VAGEWDGTPGRSELLGLAVVADPSTAEATWVAAGQFGSVADELGAVLTGRAEVVGHDVKPLLRSLLGAELDLTRLTVDTKLAAYLLDAGERNLGLTEVSLRHGIDVSAGVTSDGDGNAAALDQPTNAAQAVAAAVAMGADPAAAVAAVSGVDEVAGRYRTVRIGAHTARMLLAKNPAGWQEALSMVDKTAAGVVISVNGQVPDGEDLSWLWDVRFEHFGGTHVVAAGERGTDLAVRLGYAGVEHSLVHDTVKAIEACPPGHVEVVANYTAFLQLQRAVEKHHG